MIISSLIPPLSPLQGIIIIIIMDRLGVSQVDHVSLVVPSIPCWALSRHSWSRASRATPPHTGHMPRRSLRCAHFTFLTIHYYRYRYRRGRRFLVSVSHRFTCSCSWDVFDSCCVSGSSFTIGFLRTFFVTPSQSDSLSPWYDLARRTLAELDSLLGWLFTFA